nr:hypothetical protein Iba_chr12bCG13080 [Ipomoea batatas]
MDWNLQGFVEDFEPSSADQMRMPPQNPSPMSDTSSILAVLHTMTKDNCSHFKAMRKAIRRTKRATDETKACVFFLERACVVKEENTARSFVETQIPLSSQPSCSRNPPFEEVVTKSLESTESMMTGMRSMKHNYFELKERVDLSCVKLDLVNENISTVHENKMCTIWDIAEIKEMFLSLSKALASTHDRCQKRGKIEETEMIEAGNQSARPLSSRKAQPSKVIGKQCQSKSSKKSVPKLLMDD